MIYKKSSKKLNRVRKNYVKQLKKLPKKAKSSNKITKLGLKAVKVLR